MQLIRKIEKDKRKALTFKVNAALHERIKKLEGQCAEFGYSLGVFDALEDFLEKKITQAESDWEEQKKKINAAVAAAAAAEKKS